MLDSNLNLELDFEPLQSPKEKRLNIYTFELIQCPTHPGYGVEVFCTKESQDPSLLCVKCILDPEISKEIKGVRLIAIRDIITKSIEKSTTDETRGFGNDASETLKQKYHEFNSRSYLESFERHVDNQMDKLDKELEKMRGSIQKLREQFAEFFEKQMDYLRKQNYGLKALVADHIEDRNEMDRMSFNSIDALLHELSAIENFQDYQKFIRLLYRKNSYADANGNDMMINKILGAMDRMRTQVLTMKSMKVDTRILEDLREKIESINLLDKSITIADLSALDPGLEGTIERIRRMERKAENLESTRSTYPRIGSSKKNSPADGIIRKKPSTLEEIFNQRLGYEKAEIMGLKTPAYIKKYLQHGNGSDSHSKLRNTKDFYGLAAGTEAVVNLHQLIESTYNPMYDASWDGSKPQVTSEFLYSSKGNRNSSGKRGVEQRHFARNYSSGEGGNPLGYRSSYYEELKKERELNAKFMEKANDSFSLYDNNARGLNKNYQALDSLQEHSKNARISSHAYDTLIDDWLDENLNGFVVFQNTLKDQSIDAGLSANDLWLQLPRPERDEYITIALMARARIKEEFKKQNIPDLFQLQELINQKISEVKK